MGEIPWKDLKGLNYLIHLRDIQVETLGVKLRTVEQKMPEDLKVYTELLHHQYRHKQDKPPVRPLRPLSRAEEREYRKEIASGTAALRGIMGKNPIQAALR